MEIEIVCKETIKPLSSTPSELRNLPLCWFDQRIPNTYIQLLYFYNNNSNISSCRGRLLKDSLSKVLTFYYPFAGRLRHGGYSSIDCNDMGATFLEAKLRRCSISDGINASGSQRDEILKLLCYNDMKRKDPRFNNNPLLSVQLTKFDCRGEEICVSLAHKVADMVTFTNFMNDWASIARSSGGGVPRPAVCPRFDAASLFPPDFDVGSEASGGGDSGTERVEENVCCSRLMFEGSKIAALRAMVSEKVENPTRVQMLTALIYKAAISAK